MTSELERTPLDTLAERFTAGFTGSGFASCCTPDVGYEDPVAVQPLEGIEALERHAAALRAAFPDLRVERPAAPLGTGDQVALPWRVAGTHRGDLGMLPATDRFLTLNGVHWIELVDGEIRRARGFFDLYGASVQLGLLPERGGLGEAALLLVRGFGLRRGGTT